MYAITRPECLPQESAWLLALLRAGVTRVHIRKPEATPQQIEALVTPLVEAGYAHRVVLHAHWALALRLGIGQVHLREAEYRQGQAAQVRRQGLSASVSLHKWEDALALSAAECAYAWMSPLFESVSKVGYCNPTLLREAERYLPQLVVPIVALGGITVDTAYALRGKGFEGVASIGTLFPLQGSREEQMRGSLAALNALQAL